MAGSGANDDLRYGGVGGLSEVLSGTLCCRLSPPANNTIGIRIEV